jgi:hypothetical protein
MSYGNQGVALMQLSNRRRDKAQATAALRQIEQARDVMRDGAHAPFTAYFEAQMQSAQALIARLNSAN